MAICPKCKNDFSDGEKFCPTDGVRLMTASQVASVDPTDPLIGTILADRYRLLRVLGTGGMGVVYEAEHLVIEKHVAIKVLRPSASEKPDVVARFRQEAKSASRIGHPNIIDISDFGVTPFGSEFLVMELLKGEDLSDVLAREHTLPVPRAVDIILQCCRALGAAHAKGIVHRDLKPENIFLVSRGDQKDFVKIVDFGIAKMSDLDMPGAPGRKLTKTGMIFGTPEYMSTEQAHGRKTDHRADIYSLGVIMYEMFAGRVPFVGASFMAVLTAHMLDPPLRIRQLNESTPVPVELEDVILSTLEKDPDDRPQSMSEFAVAIEDAMARAALASSVAASGAHAVSSPETAIPLVRQAADTKVMGSSPDVVREHTPRPIASPTPIPEEPPRRRGGGGLAFAVFGVGVVAAAAGAYALFGNRPATGEPDISPLEPILVGGPDAGGGADDAGADSDAVADAAEDAVVAEAPTVVEVDVTSRPVGATVSVGSERVCAETPCTIELPVGEEVEIVLRRGNRRARRLVTAEEGTELAPFVLQAEGTGTGGSGMRMSGDLHQVDFDMHLMELDGDE